VQSFVGVVPAQGEARPGWKVLRVLGNSLGLPGFEFESSEQVRAGLKLEALQFTPPAIQPLPTVAEGSSAALVRLNELPVYASDMLVRQAESLQATRDGRDAATVQLPRGLWTQLSLNDGELVRVAQGQGHALLPAKLHPGLAEGVVRVAGGLAATAALGAGFGAITVEKGAQ
jgi:NADH-quinone oxidoreductase subunit G